MYVTTSQLLELGVSRSEIEARVSSGEWQMSDPSCASEGNEDQPILVSSLPRELQVRWMRAHTLSPSTEQIAILLAQASPHGLAGQEAIVTKLLLHLTTAERFSWIAEAVRLARLVERYALIKPKRRRSSTTGKRDYVEGVRELCREAPCQDTLILSRHPHRSRIPAPNTLDGWLHSYRREGLVMFLRGISKQSAPGKDYRRAQVPSAAVAWINSHWRRFHGSRHLYQAFKAEALKQGWKIPSESWLYRQWRQMPEIVKTVHQEGRSAYESKHAIYVPRDYSDLEALQVLCGDHSERDVTVLLPDGTLARPWLTVWQDLRTGLIWGWHLDLTPSSVTAGLAYADGVENFGAQPLSRPIDGFFSYVSTDRGRDYRSHSWDGKVIAVHEQAMRLDGGLEFLRVERRVGILDELNLKHLLARGRNAKEKPVERVFKDISEWEQNSFAEYCGRDAKHRPDAWRAHFASHQRFAKGQQPASPFMPLGSYREHLARFITQYNSSPHERSTLGGNRVVPLEEYQRLYTTHYKINSETLALLLMKADRRVIRKNGVQCFQKHWFYFNEAMSRYKGQSVEVRYADSDYSKVWVILPGGEPCEARLVTPTSLLHPNKQTLQVISEARARERQLIRDYALIQQSAIRGEPTEDRVSSLPAAANDAVAFSDATAPPAQVHAMSRLDRRRLRAVATPREVTAADVARVSADTSIFDIFDPGRVSEFDGDE